MEFNRKFKKIIATVSCFAFSLSIITGSSPIWAKTVQDNSTLKDVKLMSRIYEMSVRSFKKHKNPNEFLWGIKHLIDSDVSVTIAVALAHTSSVLPTVDVNEKDSSFTVNYSDSKKIVVTPVNLSEGKFLIGKKKFQWRLEDTFQGNIKRIQTIFQGSDKYSFLDLILPTAHAGGDDIVPVVPPPTEYDKQKNKKKDLEESKKRCTDENGKRRKDKKTCSIGFWIGITLALIAVGLIIYLLTKKNKKKNKPPTNTSSTGGGTPTTGGENPGGGETPPADTPWTDAESGITEAVTPTPGNVDESTPSLEEHSGYDIVT